MVERVEGGREESGWKKEVEREVRRGGKRERRIAGGGTLVGGWGLAGSGGGDLGVGMGNGRFGGFVAGVDSMLASQDVKSSHGSSSSLVDISDSAVCRFGSGTEGIGGDFCVLTCCTKLDSSGLSVFRVTSTASGF